MQLYTQVKQALNECHRSPSLCLSLSFIHSFIHSVYFYCASLRVHYYSEAIPTTAWYCVGINTPKRYRQLWVTWATRTCPRSLRCR